MDVEIHLPSPGQDITEAFVVEWLVQPGDPVEEGTPIVVVMTDKANIEIESTGSGIVVECRYAPEERVNVGEVLAVIRTQV